MPKAKVLVVDDSVLIRQVLHDALTAVDYDVVTAVDGEEALKLVAESHPDVVIADILMPRVDGWALCEHLRRDPATRELPLILLTTERDVPKRIKGLEMGADDYVCKPFSKEEVVARVESLMRRASGKGGDQEFLLETLHLSGHTDHVTVPDLLQLMSLNGKTGALHLRGRSVATIFFKQGQIINAETQGLQGKKALFRIMTWPEAEFDFEPGEAMRSVRAALSGTTASVLMEGFAQLDELRDMRDRLPPLDRRVRSTEEIDDDGEELSVTQRIIIRVAEGGATLEAVIDAVPDEDLVAYRAIDDLLDRGLLEISGPLPAA